MPAARREARLGWFVPFMNAWSTAEPATRAEVEHAVQAYAAKLITTDTFMERVSRLLGLSDPEADRRRER